MTASLDVLVFYVPIESAEAVLEAVFDAGAGAIGDYDKCAFRVRGTGQFRPLTGADPAIGSIGRVEQVAEERIEVVLERTARADVVAALRRAHPYEEPAFHVIQAAGVDDVGDPDA